MSSRYLDDPSRTWEEHLSALPVVRCLPLASVLASLGVAHINLFVLDVEGAELSILQSVAWERVSFDVLCVEDQVCVCVCVRARARVCRMRR